MVYSLKTAWVVFRAGWLCKAIHTIFDYLDASPKNDRQVARAYSNWPVSDSNNSSTPVSGSAPQSGRPPSLNALNGVKEENYKYWRHRENPHDRTYDHQYCSRTLAKILFQKYLEADIINDDMANLLTAVVLLRLRPFIELLGQHPKQDFGNGHILTVPYKDYRREPGQDDDFGREDYEYADYNKLLSHPFLAKLHSIAKRHLFGDLSLLIHWGDIIETDFVKRNWTFVSTHTLLRVGMSDNSNLLKVDTRPVLENMYQIANHVWNLKEETRANTNVIQNLTQAVVTKSEVSAVCTCL